MECDEPTLLLLPALEELPLRVGRAITSGVLSARVSADGGGGGRGRESAKSNRPERLENHARAFIAIKPGAANH